MTETLAWRSLVRKREFQQVYEQGVKLVGRLVVVYLYPAPDTARAVVASKKVGNAVARNRAKRLLREALRLGPLGQPDGVRSTLERLAARPRTASPTGPEEGRSHEGSQRGLWVVLVARQRILTADSHMVRQELQRLLEESASPTGP